MEPSKPVPHVIAGGGKIKVQHRCDAGGTTFWVVRRSFT
jgi:hypothetical protein